MGAYWTLASRPQPVVMLSLFSYTNKDHLPRDGITPKGLGPFVLIITQENASETCLQAKSDGGIFHLWIHLPR